MENIENSAFLISIIIPVLNETKTINTTLAHLKNSGMGDDCEIILVDGASSGNTLKVVNDPNVVKIRSSKGRGLQMNQGAVAANGNVLVFLHSDTYLPNNAANAIRAALADNHVVGGAFDLSIQSDRQVYKIIAAVASFRSRITRIPYGDQAIFIKKKFFFRIGGFQAIPIMEDVELMRRIKKKRYKIIIIPDKVKTSSRRWQKEGVLYCTLRNWFIMLLYLTGVSPTKLIRFYNY
ncbi:TIGR04283 family arsenosugar biosynthesis glycosyltransferase [Desulfococcaceae bacterium HSG7]|nr:TIGR04283 family arsenosugar biosynthesis glycosyltransferase [Desulfococcaceae bacterium HSG7]